MPIFGVGGCGAAFFARQLRFAENRSRPSRRGARAPQRSPAVTALSTRCVEALWRLSTACITPRSSMQFQGVERASVLYARRAFFFLPCVEPLRDPTPKLIKPRSRVRSSERSEHVLMRTGVERTRSQNETTDARVDRIMRLPNGACWTVLAYWREAA